MSEKLDTLTPLGRKVLEEIKSKVMEVTVADLQDDTTPNAPNSQVVNLSAGGTQ